MDSEIFRLNNHCCSFSNDGRFLALAFQGNLLIKNTGTFDTFQSFAFADLIEYIEWSPDSEYILCCNIKKALVQVFSICYPEWKCKLIEGSAGLERVTWAPTSKHLITTSDFNIQLSIWSLKDRNVTYIQNLKSSCNTKLEFCPHGKRLALVITDEGRDSVVIYKTNSWKISRKLICERLSNIDGICWSPNGELLCIWCSIIGECKLLIFSMLSESHIGVFSPDEVVEGPEMEPELKKELKGIEKVKWMPSGQLLAIAGCNESVVLLNHITWKPVVQLYHDPVISENNYLNKVYKECVIHVGDPNKIDATGSKHILEEINRRPINIPIANKDGNAESLIAEVDILEFSACGRYLATRHQVYPTTLWIWDITADSVEYLVLRNAISAAKWDCTCARLMVFTETAHMFEWTPEGAACISTPKGISVSDARWHPHGKILALCGYNKVAVYRISS